jgi:FtsK/SpoIIIE family
VLVVDEMAEMAAVESADRDERARQQARLVSISRLCRLGRAAGIHVIAATQRPDAEAVPGQIKANLPATVAFHVRDEINSRILLGDGNTTAAGLPPWPGRAVWQWDIATQVQVPWLDRAEAGRLLALAFGAGPAAGGTDSVTLCPPSAAEAA